MLLRPPNSPCLTLLRLTQLLGPPDGLHQVASFRLVPAPSEAAAFRTSGRDNLPPLSSLYLVFRPLGQHPLPNGENQLRP